MAGNSEEIASSRDGAPSALASAIREVKNNLADRDDVVIDMRDAQHARLELLATELAPVFAEVPNDIEIFDFALSSGLQSRLWIDAVAHIAMGRDRRTYRFEVDTRRGRAVVAVSEDVEVIATAVTDYVARRLVERERALSTSRMVFTSAEERPSEPALVQSTTPLVQGPQQPPQPATAAAVPAVRPARRFDWGDLVFAFLLGGLIGAALFQGVLWYVASGMPLPEFLERLFGPTSI